MTDTDFTSSVKTELTLSRDDLARLLGQAFPMTIPLGDAKENHSLVLTDLGDVHLVANVGLRVSCRARVHWPLFGIEVPVAINALTALLVPSIRRDGDGDSLVLRLSVEETDFAALPAALDERVTAAINLKLAAPESELVWNFARDLTYSWKLPSFLLPPRSFGIRPTGGTVRTTEGAVVYAVFFDAALASCEPPALAKFAPDAPSSAATAALAPCPPATPRPSAQRSSTAGRAATLVLIALAVCCCALLIAQRVSRSH